MTQPQQSTEVERYKRALERCKTQRNHYGRNLFSATESLIDYEDVRMISENKELQAILEGKGRP